MDRRQKIGILGGTFDPIHDAHLRLGREALDKLGLDKIIFMPTGNPYLKSGKRQITSAFHRMSMVNLAIKDEPRFCSSMREINRQGETYTADTLRDISTENPDKDYYFIMGADSLHDMERWYLPEVIFKHASIIVANRNHQVEEEKLYREIAHLKEKFQARIYLLEFESMDISSSDMRKKLQMGELETLPIPKAVIDYIRENKLYLLKQDNSVDISKQATSFSPLSETQIHAKLQTMIKPSRYKHTLGVVDTAVKLAEHYGTVSSEKARIAALLHDCGKNAGDALSHAGIGARLASDEFGVNDADILSAIAHHTTGREEMSDLEKIIFVADYIEPGRDKAPNLEELRQKAFVDLNETMALILKDTLSYLQQIGADIDEQSVKTYQYYNSLI